MARAGLWSHRASAGSIASRNSASSEASCRRRLSAVCRASSETSARAAATRTVRCWSARSSSRTSTGMAAASPGILWRCARLIDCAAAHFVVASGRSSASIHKAAAPFGYTMTPRGTGRSGSVYIGDVIGSAARDDDARRRQHGTRPKPSRARNRFAGFIVRPRPCVIRIPAVARFWGSLTKTAGVNPAARPGFIPVGTVAACGARGTRAGRRSGPP